MRFNVRRWVWRPVEFLLGAALRTVLAAVLFVACASALTSWLGYDVPGVTQMREYLNSVGRLSDLLS